MKYLLVYLHIRFVAGELQVWLEHLLPHQIHQEKVARSWYQTLFDDKGVLLASNCCRTGFLTSRKFRCIEKGFIDKSIHQKFRSFDVPKIRFHRKLEKQFLGIRDIMRSSWPKSDSKMKNWIFFTQKPKSFFFQLFFQSLIFCYPRTGRQLNTEMRLTELFL